MRIFFTASYSDKEKNQKTYDKAVETLERLGCEVISLEVQSYEDLLGKPAVKALKKNEIHYMYVKQGIQSSNAVVIEATRDNFRLGFEAALALVYNKPVLCISQEKDYSKYIKHKNFFSKKYTAEAELTAILREFVDEVRDKHISVRFNGYFTPEQMNFLKWISKHRGKNVSEAVRDLIQEELDDSRDYEELVKL